MTPELERAAVQHALAQGWLAPARLREALLLREHLRATGRPAELVPLLGARFLRPEHARDLERRLLGASTPVALAPPPPVTAPDLERSVDLAARPADQDPAPVRQFLSSLPGLAAMARDATVSLVTPGRGPAPAPVLPQAVPRTLGPYEVVRELARGGMGAVYVARHPRLDRQVALKILLGLDPARLKRFEIEARATAKLRHPNIVPIHEVGEEGATRYLVMDLIEGESLKDRIERLGPLDPVEAARMTEKVARALDYAHRRGVLHRDMKPSNVLVDLEGEPLITDFGLAKEVEGEERLTVTGQLIGTPVYMPPEQATGARGRIDARSDVYSLGATFYEMLTGGPPFQGDHLMNIVVAVVRDAPAPPSKARPGLDPALEAICLRCLAKDPAARYESAGALAEALGAWLRARGAPAADRARRPAATPALAAAAVVALAALALAGVAWRDLARARAARHDEARALAALANAAPGSPDEADALAALARALDHDPALVAARVALARAALRGERLDEAERLLAPVALDPRAGVAVGRLAEARGRPEEALRAYEAADADDPDLARRLAWARARAREALGHAAGAEAAWWDALRAAPLDAAPLAAIARARLLADDPAGVGRLWEEAHRQVGGPGDPDLQQRGRAEAPAVTRALREPTRPQAERLRAVVAAAGHLRDEVAMALRDLAAGEHDLLREAARASLLAQGAAPGAGADARRSAFAAWSAATLAGELPHEGALAAVALLEQAPWVGADDREALERLARARAPLARAALALALPVAATRDEGLPLDAARALLRVLVRDDDARVAQGARAALGALDALAPGADGAPPELDERAVLLARRLARLPGTRPALLRPGHGPALAGALERRPTPALWTARAWDDVERGAPDEALRAVERALALDAAWPDALELRAQLAWTRGERPGDDGLAAVSDPAAAAAARRRLEFTRRFGVPALPAPAGALRAVVAPRAGASTRGHQDALTLADPDQARVTAQGLETKASMFVRTRFAFRAWHGLRVECAGMEPVKHMIYLGASHDGGVGDGLLLHTYPPNGDAFITIDRVFLGEWRHGDRPGREGLEGAWARPFAGVWSDGRLLARVHVPARERVGAGAGYLDLGWGGGRLRALVYEGVWEPLDDAPAPLDPARVAALEAALTPLDPRTRLVSENRQAQGPVDLAGLRGQELMLFARGRWLMTDRFAECVFVPEVTGDFEARVRVVFPALPGCSAGLALRPSRDQGDALWFGAGGDARNHVVQVSSQRDMTWEKPLRRRPWTPERPVLLVLQRVGDWLTLRFGPDATRLEDLGGPLYFPFDGPVDVGLSARNYEQREPFAGARFDGFDLRVGR